MDTRSAAGRTGTIRRVAAAACGVALLLALAACENNPVAPAPSPSSAAPVTTSGEEYPSSYTYSSASPVIAVDFPAGAASRTITITGVAGRSLYLTKTNTSATTVASASTGGAASAGSLEPLAAVGLAQNLSAQDSPAQPVRRDSPAVAAWNSAPPPRAATEVARSLFGPPQAVVNYGTAGGYTEGSSTRQFWVTDASDSFVQITATLRVIGQHCYVWVANATYDNFSGSDTDGKITLQEARDLAAKFDGTSTASTGAWTDGIYRRVSSVFGTEWGGGSGGSGGIDGDQHVFILVYDVDYDYSASQTGGTFGYFWGKDEYTQTDLGGPSATTKSNEAEIFYLDAHFTDLVPKMMFSTLAHEFQHMVNFNQKYIRFGSTASNPAWVNEMCSMVAEDLLAAPLGLSDNEAPYGRLKNFNYHYADTGVTEWLAGNDMLKSYAEAYAFGAYLLRNWGGPALFSSIVQSGQVGTASVTAALTAAGYSGASFESVLARFGEALVFGSAPAGSTAGSFNKAVSATVGGISHTAKALDIFSYPQVSLSNSSTGYSGPAVYSTGASFGLAPAGVAVLSQTSWLNMTGSSATVTLTKPASSAVKLSLLVK